MSAAVGQTPETRNVRGVALYDGVGRAIPAPSVPVLRDLDRVATKIANELAVRGNLSRWEHDYLDVLSDSRSRLMRRLNIRYRISADLEMPLEGTCSHERRYLPGLGRERDGHSALGCFPTSYVQLGIGIGRKHIEAFATYFYVSPAVFLPEPS